MAISIIQVSNNSTFGGWLSVTNQLVNAVTQNTVSIDSTSGGNQTTGNGYVTGHLGASYIHVGNGVVGGNISTANSIYMLSNTVFYNTTTNAILTVSSNTTNSGVTLSPNSINLTPSNNTNITGQYLVVTTLSQFNNTVTVANTLSVTGNGTFSNAVTITGNTTFSNTISVVGNGTFSNAVTITGNTTFSNVVYIGANVQLTTTQLFVGNTTANSVYTGGSIQVANTTNTVTINPTSVTVGTTVVNTTTIAVGTTTVNSSLVNATSVTGTSVNTVTLYSSGHANVESLNIANTSATSTVNGSLVVNNLTINGTLTYSSSGTATGNLVPAANSFYLLGNSSYVWASIYSTNTYSNNITVYNTLSSNNISVSGNATFSNNINSGTISQSGTGSRTFSNSSPANVDVVSVSSFRSLEYLVQLTDSTLPTPSYHLTKILVLSDGTNPYITEYGTVYSNINLGTFTAIINGGNIALQLTPNSANVVCKFTRTAITV